MYGYRTFSTRTKHPVLTRSISYLWNPFSANPKLLEPRFLQVYVLSWMGAVDLITFVPTLIAGAPRARTAGGAAAAVCGRERAARAAAVRELWPGGRRRLGAWMRRAGGVRVFVRHVRVGCERNTHSDQTQTRGCVMRTPRA